MQPGLKDSPGDSMSPISVTFLGVGDGGASPTRNHASFLYRLGRERVLLDAGEPVSRILESSRVGADRIDRLILSHLHADHIGGLLMQIQSWWLRGRRKPLTIHLPTEGIQPLQGLLSAAYLFDELLPFPLNYHPLKVGEAFACGRARVTAFPTGHLRGFERRFARRHPAGYQAFCFLVEFGGCRIGHSADLGSPEDLEPLLQEPLDLLICELAHFTPQRLFRYLEGRTVRQMALIHLGERYWRKREEVRGLAARLAPSLSVSVPRDGDAVHLLQGK